MKKILIIEDDPAVASSFSSRLEKSGYAVETAADGQAGYYAIYNKPDLVLLDLNLPQMDGLRILGKIRAQKQFQKLPIFILADTYRCSLAADAMAAGANSCFCKEDPNALDDLVEGINETLAPFINRSIFGRNKAPAEAPAAAARPPEQRRAAASTGPASQPAASAPPAVSNRSAAHDSGRTATRHEASSFARELADEPGSESEATENPSRRGGESREAAAAGAGVNGEAHRGAAPKAAAAKDPKKAKEFLEQISRETLKLRSLFMMFSTARPWKEQRQATSDFRSSVENFRREALECGFEGLAAYLEPIEALAAQEEQNDGSSGNGFGPTVLQTLAAGVDLLVALNDRTHEIAPLNGVRPSALVVDDEIFSRMAVALALEKSGFSVTSVGDAESALHDAEQAPFDLILLDVEMPGLNGFGLCSRIRCLPAHKKTPVIFVSALNDFRSRASSRVSGGNQFIIKPIRINELRIVALTHIIRRRLKI